ncbi:MAG TPA: hypothetical protein VJP76_02175 [Candidatus Tumulicola sp.]|nr:hypothetical protein [Candidatus Tumulicola sp.]
MYVLGGNGSTLAAVNSFLPEGGAITVRLVPLAWTPIGVAIGRDWQNVGIALAQLVDWVDRTFPPEDERSFVAPGRDAELLARIGWSATLPAALTEENIVNLEDLPGDVTDALALPPALLVQCAACRRLCVRDDFVLRERQLCAWDYHAQIFGRRGPWRSGPYEERHFESLPSAAYVAPLLLPDLKAEGVLLLSDVGTAVAREAINVVLAADPQRPHVAVKTDDGYALLRELTDAE